jgi:hypothetical protein
MNIPLCVHLCTTQVYVTFTDEYPQFVQMLQKSAGSLTSTNGHSYKKQQGKRVAKKFSAEFIKNVE